MAKEKKNRKGYLKSMVAKGTGASGQYSKYKDYDPSDVHEGDITYTRRSPSGEITLTDSPDRVSTADQWASRLGNSGGLRQNAPFRFKGSLYKIKATTVVVRGRPKTTYTADPVKA